MCWYSSIIELKNARWNIEIPPVLVRAAVDGDRYM